MANQRFLELQLQKQCHFLLVFRKVLENIIYQNIFKILFKVLLRQHADHFIYETLLRLILSSI